MPVYYTDRNTHSYPHTDLGVLSATMTSSSLRYKYSSQGPSGRGTFYGLMGKVTGLNLKRCEFNSPPHQSWDINIDGVTKINCLVFHREPVIVYMQEMQTQQRQRGCQLMEKGRGGNPHFLTSRLPPPERALANIWGNNDQRFCTMFTFIKASMIRQPQ